MRVKEPYDRYLMMVGLAFAIGVFSPQRPFWGVFLVSLVFTFACWEGNYRIASYARIKYPRFEESRKRILFQVSSALVYTILMGSVLVVFLEWIAIEPYHGGYHPEAILQGLLITAVVSIVYETVYYFQLWKASLLESERLKKNQARLQFESLKNQVNPHFLFNSLNTLSSLIPVDPEKAEKFVHEFAKIYRYVLETKDRSFVSLDEELKFVHSYLFLQKIRFENQLSLKMDIREEEKDYYIPPLTLQILVENAVKHNVISHKYPLTIEIKSIAGVLQVINKIQPRQDIPDSTKTGLNNIKQRMNLISDMQPQFYKKDGFYIAEIPLIQGE